MNSKEEGILVICNYVFVRKKIWVAAVVLASTTGHKATVGIYNFLPLYQLFSYLGFILSVNSISGRVRHFGLPRNKF